MLTKTDLTRLGLHEGACRFPDMVHNGGWYNAQADKLGWGDLTPEDIERIQENLKEDEVFVVLGEHDSFWNFVTDLGGSAYLGKTDPKEQNPGLDYLCNKAMYVLTKYTVYTRFLPPGQNRLEPTRGDHPISMTGISPEQVRELLEKDHG